jgi:hypothetical protein
MVAEATQKLGMDGVYAIKRWLESTTYLALPFNAYENQPVCTVMRLDGGKKTFDLLGHFLGEHKCPVVVEAKKYSTPGHQGSMYMEYLANAYSATAYDLKNQGDVRREYVWVTYHPFSQGKWTGLLTKKEVKAAVAQHPQFLGGDAVDDDIAELVSQRLWLLVTHDKQDRLTLTSHELHQVFSVIDRKG